MPTRTPRIATLRRRGFVHFDLRLWRMTSGLRWRIALGILLGLLALAIGIARFAFLGQFLARLFRAAPTAELVVPLVGALAAILLRPWLDHVRTMIAHRTASTRAGGAAPAALRQDRRTRSRLVRRGAYRRRDAVDHRRRRAVADLLRPVHPAGVDRRLRAAGDLRLHGVLGCPRRHGDAAAPRCSPWWRPGWCTSAPARRRASGRAPSRHSARSSSTRCRACRP